MSYLNSTSDSVIIFQLFQKHGIPSYRNYTWGYTHNLTWASDDKLTTPKTLFHLATYDLREIVQNIYLHLSETTSKREKEIEIDLELMSGLFKEVRHRNFGRCYTFQLDSEKRSFIVNHIEVYL